MSSQGHITDDSITVTSQIAHKMTKDTYIIIMLYHIEKCVSISFYVIAGKT